MTKTRFPFRERILPGCFGEGINNKQLPGSFFPTKSGFWVKTTRSPAIRKGRWGGVGSCESLRWNIQNIWLYIRTCSYCWWQPETPAFNSPSWGNPVVYPHCLQGLRYIPAGWEWDFCPFLFAVCNQKKSQPSQKSLNGGRSMHLIQILQATHRGRQRELGRIIPTCHPVVLFCWKWVFFSSNKAGSFKEEKSHSFPKLLVFS